MKFLSFFTATLLLFLMPLEGYAQFGLYELSLIGSAAKSKNVEEEKAEMSEFSYSYFDNEYSKQGHSYRSKKKVNTFINKVGKLMGEYIDCNLHVSSGMSLEEEKLWLSFRYYTTDTDFSNYLEDIVKTYGSKGYGKKTGLTLSMEMGGYVNGSAKVDETLTFTNASLSVGVGDFTITVPMASVNVSGSIKERIAKIRTVLSTKPLFQLKMDDWLYRLKDVESQEFFKPVFDDLEKKRPVKDYDSSYSNGAVKKKTATFPQCGSQNYIPTAEDSYMSHIKECLKEYDQCRTGAITKSGPGVAIWEKNGYASNKYCHKDLWEALKDCNNNKYKVNDVAISEGGYYILVYENNGYSYNGIPNEMAIWIKKYNKDSKHITSVAFTDEGHWAIVTENSYISDDYTGKVMDEAKAKYGYINSVSLSGNSVVVCCDGGVYYKNAPKKLIEKLNEIDFLPKVIKFTDNGLLLITDGDKQYDYFL